MNYISKNWLITILIVIILILSGYFIVDYYNHLIEDDTCDNPDTGMGSGDGQGKGLTQSYYLLIAFIVIICVLIPVLYLLMTRNVKKQLEDKMNLITEIVDKNGKETKPQNSDKSPKILFLKFLNYGENQVMKKLIENNGSVLQSEISRMSNMGKVKAHRILKDMEIKRIISIEKYGKTNRINLSEDVRDLFLK